MENLPRFCEFETKYRSDLDAFLIFKAAMESISLRYVYVEGTDTFYSKQEGHFGRYRLAAKPGVDGKHWAQWTIKEKPIGAKNSNIRFESNWLVTGTDPLEINAAAIKMGYTFNTTLNKKSHIYYFKDATIAFYTVSEIGSEKEHHFIEIEVDEATIDTLTELEAWNVIHKYEEILAGTGISAKKRMKLSLFEMFSKEIK